MIRLQDVSLAPGGAELLSGVTWHVRPGEHVGLVGRNGTGKTTLLRALVGELPPDDGRIEIRPRARIGYLRQQAVSGSVRSVWDEVRSGMVRLQALRSTLDRAEAAVSRLEAGAVERHAEALEAFRLAGGFSEDERIGEVLHGLGFLPEDWHRPCASFSGGWQMRIALARLLLSEPDVALLDEPTNHLDLTARSWLAQWLDRSEQAVILVSHDRHLLDAVAERIVELRGGQAHHYAGNFSAYLLQKESRLTAQETAHTRQREEIARLERFVARFKAKATKAAQARSRQRTLDRMERVEAPDPGPPLPRFRLPEAPPGAHHALELRGVTLAWPDGPPVVSGVDLTLERGMRVAVLGPNGCGKSTLLQALAGRLRPTEGLRLVGDRVRIGVFTQDLAADLPQEASALDYVTALAPMTVPERVRGVLGALGLSGEDALRPIGQLSGGEQARVALASLGVKAANVLLLDEPTNHLDVETVEVLVRALAGWEGAMLLVTHDRYLVESVATHVLTVSPEGVDLRLGVRPEDLEPRRTERTAGEDTGDGGDDYAERKRRARERERAERRIAEVENAITTAEAAIEATDAALFEVGEDYAQALALGEERKALEGRMEALMAEWEGLHERVEELGG